MPAVEPSGGDASGQVGRMGQVGSGRSGESGSLSASGNPKDRLNFLNIAEASLAEVGYCVHVAWRLGYISQPLADELEREIKRVGAPLEGLIRSTRLTVGTTT